MRKYILILMLALSHLFVLAHYSLHSVSGNVKIDSNGKQTPAAKGMTLKASDYLIIPEGGKVEIYNDLDKGIYASTKSGRISVTRLMIDARGVSADNRGNVASRLRFGRHSDTGKERLYVEKGMVKRSLGVYDPEGEKNSGRPGRHGPIHSPEDCRTEEPLRRDSSRAGGEEHARGRRNIIQGKKLDAVPYIFQYP